MLRATLHDSIAGIDAVAWEALFRTDNPFVRHEFLRALEDTGCVGPDTGWQPRHLLLSRDRRPVAAMPMYVKSHSYGEFVFDWGWAEAYRQHGLDYYPKLLTAVPFTPSTGPRIGIAENVDAAEVQAVLLEAVRGEADRYGCSGWHLLFPEQAQSGSLRSVAGADLLERADVQFHWFNRGYADFEAYLASLRSSRRKNLKRERRMVSEQGVTVRRRSGNGITDEEWDAFYLCYTTTYLKRSGHTGYLNIDFFRRLRELMASQLMLVLAERDGRIVASALFLHDRQHLYGRYWGSLEDVRCMHFEACFYQGIEFCIEKGIGEFDPGTQGEHKLLRGFEPCETRSLHWIADARFRPAIADFLAREARGTRAYSRQAEDFLPYRRGAPEEDGAGRN